MKRLFITGDTHADFGKLWRLSKERHTTKEDVVIILGDSGINYMSGGVAQITKENLSRLPLTIVCVHGNHEKRAENIATYTEIDWCGSPALTEYEYPSIIFLKDGEIYTIKKHTFFVIGGAYSPDKHYRISHNYPWFSDEQPSEETKKKVESILQKGMINVDFVLTHTCPYRYIPFEELDSENHYGEIDYTTEKWLDHIMPNIIYNKWFCGHYHINKEIEKMCFMFDGILELS